MIYKDILYSVMSEARKKISNLQDCEVMTAILDYMEAYRELNDCEEIDIETIQSDARNFHEQIMVFLSRIVKRCNSKGIPELLRDKKRHIFGAAYALVGKCHEKGWFGAKRNLELAVEYYTRGTACKSPMGTFELAGCFEVGKGVDRDFDRACSLYRMSYKLGYIRGLHKYARILLRGNDYVQRNILDGHYILKQTMLQKNRIYIAPYYDLGMLYKSNVYDIFNDNRYAFEIFLLGGTRGCKYCQYKLGEEYEKGEVVDEDLEKAVYWYYMSAKNNLGEAQLKMAELLYGINSNPRDINKAIAQELNIDARVMFCNSKKYERKSNLTSLELGALKTKPLVDFKSLFGNNFNRFVEGYKMARAAASHGNKEAILLVAEALEKGLGTDKSLIESLWWYKIAEGLGCENVREKMHILEVRIGKKIF